MGKAQKADTRSGASTMASSSSSQSTPSASSIVTSLVFNGAIFLVFIIAFLFLRQKHRRIYQPKTYVETVRIKPRPLKKGFMAWLKDLVSRSDTEILRDAGLDGYFFLRYMRFIFFMMIAGIIILYPIMLSVNATGGAGQSQFDILAFSNVADPKRFYAHVFLGWIYFGFILFSIYREFVYYISVRQAVLTSPAYASRLSSRSILISTVPEEFKSVDKISSIFEGVKFVWISRNYKDLAKLVKERNKFAGKIEAAEVKLISTAVKNKLKGKTAADSDNIDDYVPRKKRPSMRLKPIIGKKVDTIDHSSERVEELNAQILEKQRAHDEFPTLNSVFVSFHNQEQAEFAMQTLSHHRALQMAPRYIGVRPDDVIWPNLRLFWWERLIRTCLATAAITALVIFWAIPVAFVGSLSNLKALMGTSAFSWLSFLNNLPSWLFGLVSSLLPTILLAVLMMLLPIFIRFMGVVSGCPSHTLVEYYTQNAYFAFQVVQVFLVTTIASSAVSVVMKIIENPTSAMSLLSNNLPKSSNFYISYFLLQGFTAAGGMFLQIVALILFYVLSALLDGTPRKKWNRQNVIGGPGWGTVFPVYTNLGVIAITYSLISPILLAFAAITFGLIYLAYLHNLMFVQGQTDGRGMYYCRALYQTFTGLYLGEVCMLGLFAVAKAWGPLVLMAILIAATVFVQIVMQKAFAPLQQSLPRDLMHHNAADPFKDESNHLQSSISNGQVTSGTSEKSINQVRSEEGLTEDRENGTGSSDGKFASRINPTKKIGVFTRYFLPHRYLTPGTIQSQFLPELYHERLPELSDNEEASAFCNPAVNAENPVVWFARDPYGLSTVEVDKLRAHDVNATDVGSVYEINEKKKKAAIVANGRLDEIPVWEKPVMY